MAVRSRAGLSLLLAISGCSGQPAGPAPPPPPPPPAQLRIEPSEPALTAGSTIHFSAFLSSGLEAAVSWSLDDAAAGSITPDGRFIHSYCFSPTVKVRARLLSDPTVTGIARVLIGYSEPAFVALRSIELSNGQPAQVDSVAGTVRFTVGVEARAYSCRAVRKLRMSRLVGFDVLTLDSLLFDPPLETSVPQSLSWQTTTVPNGFYGLSFIATRADGSVESSPFTVRVRNP